MGVAKELRREDLFAEANKRFAEHLEGIDDMILTVLKAQITVERFMIELLKAYGKDPKHFYFTSKKIEGCKLIDPSGVGATYWNLLTLCTHVRNELAHSLDNDAIKAKMDAVRTAYIAATDNERQRQSIRDMDDTQMVTSALYHCGSLIVIAIENKKKP